MSRVNANPKNASLRVSDATCDALCAHGLTGARGVSVLARSESEPTVVLLQEGLEQQQRKGEGNLTWF